MDGYYDGKNLPMDEVNSNLPSARRVMEEIFSKARPHKDKTVSHILLEFGHFIVQDILGSRTNYTEPYDVPCDGKMNDYVFCPVTGAKGIRPRATTFEIIAVEEGEKEQVQTLHEQTMEFHRQKHIDVGQNKPRATVNGMTSFLDLSNIYGTTRDLSQATWASQHPGGKLSLTEDGLLGDFEGLHEDLQSGINTTPGAYSLYIVFIRYHNKLADEYFAEHPDASEEEIFEEARMKTIAVYQSFVEEKYVPTLLGDKLDNYEGYDEFADPSIDEYFAAVSFRYAHSSFTNVIRMVDKDYVPYPSDPLLLRDVFKQDVVQLVADNGGIEPFMRGLTLMPAKQVDAAMVEDFNVWAEATSVLDVQRGRDVGIPRYNDVRQAFELTRMGSIEELVQNRYADDSYHNDTDYLLLVSALKELYNGDINKVDAYVGALIEAPTNTLDNMGPLFMMSIKNQFTRIRNGDRFWYKNIYPEEEYLNFPDLAAVVKEVCDGMDMFPADPYMLVPGASGANSSSGSDGSCSSSGNNQLSLLG